MSDTDKLRNKTASGAAPLAPSDGLEAKLDALIGSKLRSYYDELMAEPVPNRILDLLAELDAKERDEAPGSNG
jgi:hypothetical protein